MERAERIDRVLKYRGVILDFYDDLMELPDGSVSHWDYIEHRNGAAAVLPVLPDGRILMVRQYRNALNQEMLELPAGAKDGSDEPSEQCAARELEEETGYRAGNMEKLITVCTTGAFCNESIDIYLATELTKTHQRLDKDEFLQVEIWDLHTLCNKIFAQEITDAKTVSGILAYKCRIENPASEYCK